MSAKNVNIGMAMFSGLTYVDNNVRKVRVQHILANFAAVRKKGTVQLCSEQRSDDQHVT